MNVSNIIYKSPLKQMKSPNYTNRKTNTNTKRTIDNSSNNKSILNTLNPCENKMNLHIV